MARIRGKNTWINPNERRWDRGANEVKFENLITAEGYEIIAIKEFTTKTEYKLSKNGIEVEYALNGDSKGNADDVKVVNSRYAINKEYSELKAMLNV